MLFVFLLNVCKPDMILVSIYVIINFVWVWVWVWTNDAQFKLPQVKIQVLRIVALWTAQAACALHVRQNLLVFNE